MFHVIAYKNPKTQDPSCRHSGLGITASGLAEVLNDNRLPSLALAVANGEYLWNYLLGRKDVTHVTLCAPFFDTAFLERMCRHFPYVHFTVTYHSNWGFLQQDRWAVRCLMEQLPLQERLRNFTVSGNCKQFVEAAAAAFGSRVVLLPNLYYQHGMIQRGRGHWQHGDLDIGILGATRVLKNVLTGVVAAFIIGRTVKSQHTKIHVSTGRVEHGAGVMDTVRNLFVGQKHFELIENPWEAWPDFRIRVRQMDLLLQPSFTETFNNVTADGVCEGVPSVVGFPISWVPDSWRACPDDASAIAATGARLLADTKAAAEGYEALREYNRRSLEAWRGWLL